MPGQHTPAQNSSLSLVVKVLWRLARNALLDLLWWWSFSALIPWHISFLGRLTISSSSTKLKDFNIENWGTHPTHTIFFTQQSFLSSYYDQYCKGLSTSKHLTFTAHVCIPVLFLPSKEKLLLLEKEWLAKVAVISQPEENSIYPLSTYKTQSLGEQEKRQIPQATP